MLARRAQQGLSIIELLIAITIGLLILAAVVGIFQSNSRNNRQNETVIGQQDSARFALETITNDLGRAGYFGGIPANSAELNIARSATIFTALPFTNQCGPSTEPTEGAGWLFNMGTPLVFRSQLDTAAITTFFSCLSDVRANTDIVMIRRFAGQFAQEVAEGSTTTPGLAVGRFYLKTNRNSGSLVRWPSAGYAVDSPSDCVDASGDTGDCSPLENPAQYYAYTPRIYYIKGNSGNPQLCRQFLNDIITPTVTAPTMQEECLVDGVENLQIEWGLDTDGDDIVDSYITQPTAAQLTNNALTARVSIILRTGSNSDALTGAEKTISIGGDYTDDATNLVAGEGGRKVARRAYSTLVRLNNLSKR